MLNDSYKIEISAVNEAGKGKSTSLTLSFSKGIYNGRHYSHCYLILLDINDSRIQNYYWNGEEWELIFNISVRSFMYSIHFPFHTTESLY